MKTSNAEQTPEQMYAVLVTNTDDLMERRAERQREAERQGEAEQQVDWAQVIARSVAAVRAEVRGQLAQRDATMRDMLRALNEAVEKIIEVGEERERLIGTLRDQLHDARLDIAHVRGDLAELKLAMASSRAADLLESVGRRAQIN